MTPNPENLLRIPPGRAEAVFPLLEGGSFRLERIVSRGTPSPPGFWYDQEHPEWVLLLQGTASLEFSDGEVAPLFPGQAGLIPPRRKHRVAAVSEDAVWLALHFEP